MSDPDRHLELSKLCEDSFWRESSAAENIWCYETSVWERLKSVSMIACFARRKVAADMSVANGGKLGPSLLPQRVPSNNERTSDPSCRRASRRSRPVSAGVAGQEEIRMDPTARGSLVSWRNIWLH